MRSNRNDHHDRICAIHLDLKGLPPTFDRLLQLLPVFRLAGYNAILVEWEDMFPWTVDLRFRCETAYTVGQVRQFYAGAQEHGLQIIPLVQCLGHMETFLRPAPDYVPLREVSDQIDVLNPLADGAQTLVAKLLDDVLATAPSLRFFHLGGDEASSFGSHPDTREYIAKHGKAALYLKHVEPLIDMLRAQNVRPILWHDMTRDWDPADLKRLSEKADLMIWGYDGHPDAMGEHCNPEMIGKFKAADLTLWGAAAYKGADQGGDNDLPKRAGRIANATGWREVAEREGFAGVVATGWSRYATLRTQTEPIDGALDCLFAVGSMLRNGRVVTQEDVDLFLERTGETARFHQCRNALLRLSDVRRIAWERIRQLREDIIMQRQDARRRDGTHFMRLLFDLRQCLDQLDEIGRTVATAFDGLIEPIWVDRYLAERRLSVQDEYDSLIAAVQSKAFTA